VLRAYTQLTAKAVEGGYVGEPLRTEAQRSTA